MRTGIVAMLVVGVLGGLLLMKTAVERADDSARLSRANSIIAAQREIIAAYQAQAASVVVEQPRCPEGMTCMYIERAAPKWPEHVYIKPPATPGFPRDAQFSATPKED